MAWQHLSYRPRIGGGLRAVGPKSILSTYSQLPSVSPVMKKLILLIFLGAAFVAASTNAALFSFTTGSPDGRMATGSRTDLGGVTEIESADDFIVPSAGVHLTNATFTGLIPSGVSVTQLQVEIYRVFPNDSNVGRTSGPPTFSTPQVPTGSIRHPMLLSIRKCSFGRDLVSLQRF